MFYLKLVVSMLESQISTLPLIKWVFLAILLFGTTYPNFLTKIYLASLLPVVRQNSVVMC